jgi:hypothetical protein
MHLSSIGNFPREMQGTRGERLRAVSRLQPEHRENSAPASNTYVFTVRPCPLAMLVSPLRKQIRSIGEAAHHPVDAGISDGLQNDTAKLVFQKLDLPAAIPCLRRSSAGTTSWPFEVNVARSPSMTYTLLQVRHRRGVGTLLLWIRALIRSRSNAWDADC